MTSSATNVDNSLNNVEREKVVLLTSACNDIGKAIVQEFYASGYKIMINDIQFDELQNLENNLEDLFPKNSNDTNIAYFFGDISNRNNCKLLIEETFNKFGHIDVLINNYTIPGTPVMGKTTSNYVETETTTDYYTLEEYGISDRNLKGVYNCIREFVQYLINNNRFRDYNKEINNEKIANNKNKNMYLIINISCPYGSIPDQMISQGIDSQSGIDPFTSYRSGIKTITKTVALQLADKGIRVNAIAPGIISTNINENGKEDKQRKKSTSIPLRRIGTP